MTTGDPGSRTPPDAEHYLDLSDVEDDQPGPHFDLVLRGYDRRQVDDHVAGLRRMVAQLRAQLAVRQRRRPGTAGVTAETIPEARPPSETPSWPVSGANGSSDGADGADMVGAFNDRLQGILAAAEQEAQLVRSRAAESLLAEHAESRAALADLRAQRDAVFDDLVRLRGWLDELVATAGRPASPPPGSHAPHAPHGQLGPHGPQGPYASPPGGRPGPWARPHGPGPAAPASYGVTGSYAVTGSPGGPSPRPRPRPSPGPRPAGDGGAASHPDDVATTDVAEVEPDTVPGGLDDEPTTAVPADRSTS